VAVGLEGTAETLLIVNVSRSVGDLYECVASNGVPPAVSRQIRVTVQCTCTELRTFVHLPLVRQMCPLCVL